MPVTFYSYLQTGIRFLQGKYVTGFAKRGLPHTSDFIYLKECNFLLIGDINLNFSHNFLLCFSLLLTKLYSNSSFKW